MRAETETLDELAEEQLLCAVMLWPDKEAWPEEVAQVTAEDFSDASRAQVWLAVQELKNEGKPIDEFTVSAQLREWSNKAAATATLELGADAVTHINAAHWGSMVSLNGRRRELRRGLSDAILKSDGQDLGAIAANVQRAIRASERGTDKGGPIGAKAIVSAAMREIEAQHNNPDQGGWVQSGLEDLDRKVRLERGELCLIAARPSMGKTALATCIAEFCARDETKGCTALFSLEQSAVSIMKRLIQRRSSVELNRPRRDADWPRLVNACGDISALNLYVDDRSGLTVEDMRRALQRLPKVRLVVVDYLQLAKLPAKSDRRDLELGEVTKGLKRIAKDFDCNVVALSQLNRSVEKRTPPRPVLSDLRDSGNLEEDADVVLLLYRPEYYFPDRDDVAGKAEIIIAKQRNGATGVAHVVWNAKRTSFENEKARV